MVGAGRFERPTPCAQGRCATRLRYAPTFAALLILDYFHWKVARPSRCRWERRPRLPVRTRELPLNLPAEVVVEAEMDLLDQGRGTRRHREQEVAQRRERTAPFAGERDGVHPHGTSLLECGDDVPRGAGRADAEQNSAWLSEGLGLPGEDRVVRVVVGPRRDQDRKST